MTAIRQLTRADIEDYRGIRLFGLRESPSAFGASYAQEEKMSLDDLAQRLEGTADRWIIGAYADKELVGVIGFIRGAGDKTRHKGSIYGMYVLPAFRGRYVGRALFQEAVKRIEAIPGLKKVSLNVVTTNLPALRLYEKFGFKTFGEETAALFVDGVFHAEFYMTRVIASSDSSRT